MSIPSTSLPGSEQDFSEPGSSFTVTSGTFRGSSAKLQNLGHLLKLEAQSFTDSISASKAEKLIEYLSLYSGLPPYTIELAADAAIANIEDPHCLELVLQILARWPDLEQNNYTTVLKCFSSFEWCISHAPNLQQLCKLVKISAAKDFIAVQDILTLARHIINFIIGYGDSSRKRYTLKLLISIFESQSDARKPLVDLALQYLRKPIEYIRDQPLSKFSEKKVSSLVILLLEFIHTAGALDLARWDEAIAYSRKKALADECKQQVQAADEIINTTSIACIDLLDSETVAYFISDILEALAVPELCSSEALVRCLTIRLLIECRNFHNRYQLPSPRIFEILAKIQRPLYNIFKAEGSGGMGQIIDFLISANHPTAATYIATLECSQDPSDWRDFHMRFTNPQSRVPSMASKRWVQVLKTKPIGKMYQQTVDVMLLLSESGVPGPAYVEILKSLSVVVYEYPAFFKRIEKYLLTQLDVASSFVCDWTAHIISNYIAATKVEFSLVARTMVRVGGPGNLNYKKRCIKLLDQAYGTSERPLQTLAWKYLLVLSDDPKAYISQSASIKLCEYIETSTVENLCLIFQQILKLGPKYGALIAAVLRNPLKKKAVHRFISYLLQSLEDDNPDYQQLKVASIFISANGLYLPPSKVPVLVDLSVSTLSRKSQQNSLIILRMLQSALTTRPKIILSPKLVADMYKKMIAMLIKYSEPEIECAGRILWELASLGREENKVERKEELRKLYYSSLSALTPNRPPQVLTHLCSIISVGARAWVNTTDCIPALLLLVNVKEIRLQVVRVLCRVCTQSPDLFLQGPSFEFLKKNVFEDKSSPEWAQFMAVFLEFLESQNSSQQEKQITADVLHGHNKALVAESTLGGLFQTYFEALKYCALYSTNTSALVTAARLLCYGVSTNKVDASTCTPTIVTLCCSSNPEVSQFAHECFGNLVEQHHLNGFAKGLADATQVPQHVFKSLWEILGDENIPNILTQLVNNLATGTEFAITVYKGLTLAPLKPAHARYLEEQLDNEIYTFNGEPRFEALMVVLRAVTQYKYSSEATAELEIPNPRYVLESIGPQYLRDGGFVEVLESVSTNKKYKK